jgi:hypothetical protein
LGHFFILSIPAGEAAVDGLPQKIGQGKLCVLATRRIVQLLLDKLTDPKRSSHVRETRIDRQESGC